MGLAGGRWANVLMGISLLILVALWEKPFGEDSECPTYRTQAMISVSMGGRLGGQAGSETWTDWLGWRWKLEASSLLAMVPGRNLDLVRPILLI